MRVLGVVGQPNAGKGEVAGYLMGKGWRVISGGDVLRSLAAAEGSGPDRASVSAFTARNRAVHGNAWPSPQVADMITHDTVVEGFRNPTEVAYFRDRFGPNFKLLAVIGPTNVVELHTRAKGRGRVGDDAPLEEFNRLLEKERSSGTGAHEVDQVIALADARVYNNRTLLDLYVAVDEVLRLSLGF